MPRTPDYRWIVIGGAFAAMTVITGAFGAHLIESMMRDAVDGPRRLAAWKTGVLYQMFHSAGLILLGLMPAVASKIRTSAAVCFILAILVFSGFLYAYCLTNQKWMGVIVPLGGLSMILGWVLFSVLAWRSGHATGSASNATDGQN